LSSFFHSTQLTDMFSYELPTPNSLNNKIELIKNNESVVVYNFNLVKNDSRFFLFIMKESKVLYSKKNTQNSSLMSITENFLNANWLEREVGELHGLFFSGKKDIRNLMLPYGDTTAPMKKSYPSIGIREIFYDSTTDLLIQSPTSIQF